MSLIGALNSSKSALAAHQAAIQVTSNNVANAGNPNYTRQVARLEAAPDHKDQSNALVGSGVNLASIERQIDEALEGRLRGSASDTEAASTREQWLGRVEAVFNELGDQDLSTRLSAFFNSWSNLANNPQDMGLRQVVVQSGETLAISFRDVRTQLGNLQTDIDTRVGALARQADGLCTQIADLNRQISSAEGNGGGTANNLRDQRDAAIRSLSELADVKAQDVGNGIVNVLIGSEPVVLGTTSRGIQLQSKATPQGVITTLVTRDDHSSLQPHSGQLGGLAALRGEIGGTVDQVDYLAGHLIFELNKVHASGQGLVGFSQVSASNAVSDTTAALNADTAGLDFKPASGSFVVHIKQKGTGLTTSTLVKIDLDGAGGNDTTLDSLATTLDGIAGVSASIVGGRLKVQAEGSGVELAFSQDSSNTLAALGINSFFKGATAADIAISNEIKADPSLLAAARNGQPGDNQTARAIASLETQAINGLNGRTLKDGYESMINGLAVSTQNAKTNAEAAQTVQDTLLAQRESLSGVSLDEEAINLMKQQRAFQGAARVIAAVDDMMKTLLQL